MSDREPRNAVECPHCGTDMVNTKDSRPALFEGVKVVRRRRECTTCEIRVTTVEIPEAYFQRVHNETLKKMIIKLLAGL